MSEIKTLKNTTTMKIEITESEATVLQAIAQNWYGCGNSIPKVFHQCYTWSDHIHCTNLPDGMKLPRGKKLSGICSNLVQKGLFTKWEDMVQADDFGGRTNKLIPKTLIGMTELGFQVWIDQVYGRDAWEKAVA